MALAFTVGEVSVEEGDGQVELTLVKTGANSRDVTVHFATLDGDAKGTSMYSSGSHTCTYVIPNIGSEKEHMYSTWKYMCIAH